MMDTVVKVGVCGGVRDVLRWPVGKVAAVYIYMQFDNSDDVIRHGPHLKICIIYFRIVIYFDYACAFLGWVDTPDVAFV